MFEPPSVLQGPWEVAALASVGPDTRRRSLDSVSRLGLGMRRFQDLSRSQTLLLERSGPGTLHGS